MYIPITSQVKAKFQKFRVENVIEALPNDSNAAALTHKLQSVNRLNEYILLVSKRIKSKKMVALNQSSVVIVRLKVIDLIQNICLKGFRFM
jgi:hypothetical protein